MSARIMLAFPSAMAEKIDALAYYERKNRVVDALYLGDKTKKKK